MTNNYIIIPVCHAHVDNTICSKKKSLSWTSILFDSISRVMNVISFN